MKAIQIENVTMTNVDQDGLFEVILYDKNREKVAVYKAKSFSIDLVPGFIRRKKST